MARRRGTDQITIPPDVVYDPTPLAHLANPTPLAHLASLATARLAQLGDLDPDIALWPVTVVQRWPFVGPPIAGTWPRGWVGVDAAASLWVCTEAGEPGSWDQIPADLLSQVESGDDALSERIDTNATDIATNTTDIATNTTDITALQSAVQAIQTDGAPYSMHHVLAELPANSDVTFVNDGVTPVVFPDVAAGSDSAYDPTTGIYTCPVDGVYLTQLTMAVTVPAQTSASIVAFGQSENGGAADVGPLARNPYLGTQFGASIYPIFSRSVFHSAGAQLTIVEWTGSTAGLISRDVCTVTFDYLGNP